MDIEFKLTTKQTEAWNPLFSLEDTDLLYGGAKGGGKSYLLCVWAFLWARRLIDILHVPKLKNPLPVGFIGRKRGVDFTKTTLETWKKTIPQEGYYIREQDKEIIIEDRVKIFFGGLDDQRNINKFNSAELAFFAIDQAEETERNDIGVIEASIRLKHNDIQPPYKTLYTANPAECWLKEDFVHGKREKAIFIPALSTDNPHLPDNYLLQLEKAFSYDPVLLQAYKEGNWEVMVTENIVISSTYIDDLQNIVYLPTKTKKCIAIDPATGGDECVIYVIENCKIIGTKILHYDDTMKIVGEIVILAQEHNIYAIGVDTIGIGKGIVDRLREMSRKLKLDINAIQSAERATDDTRFFNRRAEMWWKARERIIDRDIPYPEDEELRRQLTSVRYSIINSNGKIRLEPKEKTKQRLGRSPDRADAFVYGVWTTENMPERRNKEVDYERANREQDKAMETIRGY